MNSHAAISRTLHDPKKILDECLKTINTLYENDQFDLVIRHCNKALAIDPDNTNILIYRGIACFILDDIDEARLNLENALRLNTSNNATCHYYLGIIYALKNDLSRAIDHLEKAAKLNGQNSDYKKALAIVYAEKDKLIEAADKYAHPYRINIRDFNLLPLKVLGEGTSGTVYQGEYQGKKLAIKCMEFNERIPHDAFGRIRQERNIMLSFKKHDDDAPNVVKFLGYAITETTYVLALELMENGTLTDSLATLSEPLQKPIMIDCCNGLAFLHREEIIHRDLKPDNILLSATWEAKLADFGSAYRKNFDKVTGPRGTPLFSAPEQCLGHPNDFASDCYSLSLTFWCIVARKEFPFNHVKTAEQLRTWVVDKKLRETIPLHCPANIRYVIEHGWLHEASERLTAAEMRGELREPGITERSNQSPVKILKRFLIL